MANFDDMSLQKFRLWTSNALKAYLSLREKSTEGDFDELVARAFIAWEENIPVCPDAEHSERKLLSEYKDKLIIKYPDIVLPDPLAITDGWVKESDGRQLWPPVYVIDIANYFQLSCSDDLVKQVLNEYKLGKAYRYFSCGWTREILFHNIRDSSPVCLLRAAVFPSMRLASPAYNVWAAIEKGSKDIPGGKIVTAYCNCTAGMHGTCNHIASLLFKVEHISLTGVESCTSVPCEWNIPKAKTILPVAVNSVSWTKDHYTKGLTRPMSLEKNVKSTFAPCESDQLTVLGSKVNMRQKLCTIASRSAPESRFRFLHQSQSPLPSNSKAAECPQSLPELAFKYDNVESFLEDLKFTPSMCRVLRDTTVSQNLSPIWEENRRGRITASNFHRVQSRVKTFEKNPSACDVTPLLSLLMGYEETIQTIAMKHGISSEAHAKTAYIELMKKQHTQFQAANSGLCVLLEKPYIAASVDLDIKCTCCGSGICEIKCPFSIRGQKPTPENVDCLELCSKQITVRKNHPYYSQIQGQMGVLGREYCDFFVFTFKGFLCVRVAFDSNYWKVMLGRLVFFWKKFVAPELVHGTLKHKLKITKSTDNQTCDVTALPLTSAKRGPTVPDIDDISVSKKKLCHTNMILCCVCATVCIETPSSFSEESIQCTKCYMWCHFECGNVTTENTPADNDDWFCPKCLT